MCLCQIHTDVRTQDIAHMEISDVPCCCNSLAMGLAKLAISLGSESVWMEDLPGCVRAVAHNDTIVDVQ